MSARRGMTLPIRHLSASLKQQRSLHINHTQPSLSRSTPRAQASWQQPRRNASFAASARTLFRQSPVGVTLAFFTILCGAAIGVYVNYKYQTYIIGAFHKYPEPVAKSLRKAVYYTKTDPNTKEAIKFYRQALEVAADQGMDPFSDEVMGIKIQVAFLMESVGQWPRAAEVLERIRNDNLEWMRRFGERTDIVARQARTRILAKTVAISVKLGELYGHPSIWNREMAEERLVWAVETVLKEQQRRVNEAVKVEDEGEWMSNDETGAALETLAHTYEEKDQHYLATPLFLHALSLRPRQDCHTVVLMSNLASSLAQQSPRAARAVQNYAQSSTITNAVSSDGSGPVATKEQMVENAQQWAQKALAVADGIKASDRDEECDIGCVVAIHNLGEFAEMRNDTAQAKKRYQDAVALAKRVGFAEGVQRGQERLKELAKDK